jgi:hypothetical protein
MSRATDLAMQAPGNSRRRPPLFSARKRLFMASLLFAFLFPYFTWKQAAGCALLLLLFNTLILPWLDLGVTEETALSAGERTRTQFLLAHLGTGRELGLFSTPFPFWCWLSFTVTTFTLPQQPGPSWHWATAWRL